MLGRPVSGQVLGLAGGFEKEFESEAHISAGNRDPLFKVRPFVMGGLSY